MPAEEFRGPAGGSDAELAERFGVPAEQVSARHVELGHAKADHRPPP